MDIMGPPHQCKPCYDQYQIKAVDKQVNFILFYCLKASIFRTHYLFFFFFFFFTFKQDIFIVTQGNEVTMFQPAKDFLPAIQKVLSFYS